jgi:release factor glutamine methyltransferase
VAETDRYRELISARARRIPVAHLRGFKEFFGLPFTVSPDVLIPRPETEILIQEVLGWLSQAGFSVRDGAWNAEQSKAERTADLPGDDSNDDSVKSAPEAPGPSRPHILDVATGSGAIGIALALYAPTSHLVATDKSPAALRVAAGNAEALGVSDRVQFLQGDLFAAIAGQPDTRFDVVVSNPPYIPTSTLKELEPDVRYEPAMALDGGADGLDFYRAIASQAASFLKPKGLLALEIGHDQAAAVSGLIAGSRRYAETRVVQDYAGRDRVVLATAGDHR